MQIAKIPKLEKEQTTDGDRLTQDTISIDRLGFFSPDNWDVLPFWDNNSEATSQELVQPFPDAKIIENVANKKSNNATSYKY